MPDMATMQAARPKCPCEVEDASSPIGRRVCAEPMRWAPSMEAWCCPLHGRIENGESAYEAALRDA